MLPEDFLIKLFITYKPHLRLSGCALHAGLWRTMISVQPSHLKTLQTLHE